MKPARPFVRLAQQHLGAAEEHERLAGGVGDRGAPHLRGAAEILGGGDVGDGAVAGGAEEIGFQLDGGEALGALGRLAAASAMTLAACK
jgi:hypothetical protein